MYILIKFILKKGEERKQPPIQMEFQVPTFTASGLCVSFLNERSGYNTVEWVRYNTKSGSYKIRC